MLRWTSEKGGIGKIPGGWIIPGLALWPGLSHHFFHVILAFCKLLLPVEDWLWSWEKEVLILAFPSADMMTSDNSLHLCIFSYP